MKKPKRTPDNESLPDFAKLRQDVLKSGDVIPLLPRHHIDLMVFAGDGPRFARSFLAAWSRIPLSARRRLLSHWRAGHPYGWITPSIELCPYAPNGKRAIAMASQCGHRFQFWAKRFDAMPDSVSQDVIAHELAHAIQDANGVRCSRRYKDGRAEFVDADGEYWGDLFDIEYDADETIGVWGFDAESVDRWCLRVGITRVVHFADREKAIAWTLNRINRTGR